MNDVFMAFYTDDGSIWNGTTNTQHLFTLPEERVRWVSTVEGLAAILQAENPCDDPALTTIVATHRSVQVLSRPTFYSQAREMTPALIAALVSAAKAAGKTGVPTKFDYGFVRDIEGIVWKTNQETGLSHAIYSPKRYANQKTRESKALVTGDGLLYAASQVVQSLIPIENGEYGTNNVKATDVFFPVRHLIYDHTPISTLGDYANHFLGGVIIMEKLFTKKAVRKHPAMKALIAQWGRSADKNRAKFMEYGHSGAWLVEWFEKELEIVREPAPAAEPATALANAS